MDSREIAEKFHETYERLAPKFGYSTRKESAVLWENVPEHQKQLMIATCAEVLAAIEESRQPVITVSHGAAPGVCDPFKAILPEYAEPKLDTEMEVEESRGQSTLGTCDRSKRDPLHWPLPHRQSRYCENWTPSAERRQEPPK